MDVVFDGQKTEGLILRVWIGDKLLIGNLHVLYSPKGENIVFALSVRPSKAISPQPMD